VAIKDLLRSPFSFLFSSRSQEERLATYVIREHERGRPLSEILEDPYVRNRTTPDERNRLLDRPEMVRALGDSAIADARAVLSSR
jgi:hypothetical protein